MSGTIEEIYIAPQGGAPMQRVEQVQAEADCGLCGDRYMQRTGYWTGIDECQVTLIDKANAIRAHDLWTRTFREVAEDFPEVKTEHAYIDAACMWMVKNPEWFDVAVTPNLLGDIITDLGQGGMGLAASGNIHPGRVSLFEPIHGSAPKHAGKNVASPVAAIMACSMMLDYLGEKTAATAIESVLRELFRSGRLCGAGTGDHPTNEVGDLVAGELRQPASSV